MSSIFEVITTGTKLLSPRRLLGVGTSVLKKYISQRARLDEQNNALQQENILLDELKLQTRSYNRPLPVVFGESIISGNIIWVGKVKKVLTSGSVSVGGHFTNRFFGKSIIKTNTPQSENNYYLDFAIALCEGELDEIIAIYANDTILDITQFKHRIYYGTEEQTPDHIIESYEGTDSVPAFRGMAYILFEDFPLSKFGNSVPNLTFHVKRNNTIGITEENQKIIDHVSGVTIIPGSGELVYDTTVNHKYDGRYFIDRFYENGNITRVNSNNVHGKADVLMSFDQLEKDLPNVKWISVIVGWFADGIDAGSCDIYPATEYKYGGANKPHDWSVSIYETRYQAKQVGLDEDGNLRYGGTPSDESVVNFINEAKKRGYKVCLYPMIFVDSVGKPWRGRITPYSSGDVGAFFDKYEVFTSHYINLVQNLNIDAFLIGSEFTGLTSFSSGEGVYPAVDRLNSIANTAKGVLGADTKISYAADWSEYHHADGGWYNMDKLWANDNIDFIGIDAYFPLSDSSANLSISQIKAGWTSGEGFDYYYADEERSNKIAFEDRYAWKNIRWFKENEHINPDGVKTDWVPNSKKIWFTEYGFPSVDLCYTQPNVFYDPSSTESAFPRYSFGHVDFEAQRKSIIATEEFCFENSDVIENKMLWTWDARPYPYFPNLSSKWSDASMWKRGHWVNGKLYSNSLAQIVRELCLRTGLKDEDIDVSLLEGNVDGFVVSGQLSVKSVVEKLSEVYFFDMCDINDKLTFFHVTDGKQVNISSGDILLNDFTGMDSIQQTVVGSHNRYNSVKISFLDRSVNYSTINTEAVLDNSQEGRAINLSIPIVLNRSYAEKVAKSILIGSNLQSTIYEFYLSDEFIPLYQFDVIYIQDIDVKVLVQSVDIQDDGMIKIAAISYNKTFQNLHSSVDGDDDGYQPIDLPEISPLAELSVFEVYNIEPELPENDNMFEIYLGVKNVGAGCSIYYSKNLGNAYEKISETENGIISGIVSGLLSLDVSELLVDTISKVTVFLDSGIGVGLNSVTEEMFLNGSNIARIGDEIVYFKNAVATGDGVYEISNFIRGKFNTADKIGEHVDFEKFILLSPDSVERVSLPKSLIGKELYFKCLKDGESLNDIEPTKFTPTGINENNFNINNNLEFTKLDNGDILFSWIDVAKYDSVNFDLTVNRYYLLTIGVNGAEEEIMISNPAKSEYLLTLVKQIEVFSIEVKEFSSVNLEYMSVS